LQPQKWLLRWLLANNTLKKSSLAPKGRSGLFLFLLCVRAWASVMTLIEETTF
jgi:hypothetical protein